MNVHCGQPLSLSLLSLTLTLLLSPLSESAVDSFIYAGCSQLRYSPGPTSPFESNLDSILTSLVNSASTAPFNNFKISVPGSGPGDAVYGLYQCRGDLSGSDCRRCVAAAVARLAATCPGAAGAALQLDGCLVRYDNSSFVGQEDRAVASDRCGPAVAAGGDVLARKDGVLTYLAAGGQYFRVGVSGEVRGVAQCTGDLSGGECQGCVAEAIQRLRNECASSLWGDMFLGKCYARK
ncbi:cysteine-rich repeat secretory protein 12 [Striga asiatica]|uniref:Cysteine-rich repeat secretory protein 12 n=1 Tax=Striga asiatica TaxID=4170 RepID=A0A5A7PBA3_STRAF|nr:cysteine-rich repeat secretory protein 12 [Striga asiatica]